MSLIWGESVDGWFFSPKYSYYQKCVGQVVCYIERMMFMHRLVLYRRGAVVGLCSLEVRTPTGVDPDILFHIGEHWLRMYAHGDMNIVHKDFFSVHNPDGAWGNKLISRKLFYLDPQKDACIHVR